MNVILCSTYLFWSVLWSTRNVLGLLLCAGAIALCCAVLAALLLILNDEIDTRTNNDKRKRENPGKKTWRKQRKQRISGRFAKKKIIVGNYRLRRAEVGEHTEGVLRGRRNLQVSLYGSNNNSFTPWLSPVIFPFTYPGGVSRMWHGVVHKELQHWPEYPEGVRGKYKSAWVLVR